MPGEVRRVALAVVPLLVLAAVVYAFRDPVIRRIVGDEEDYRTYSHYQEVGFWSFLVLSAVWILAVAVWTRRPRRS